MLLMPFQTIMNFECTFSKQEEPAAVAQRLQQPPELRPALVRQKADERTAADLLAFAEARLARYKLPKDVVFVEALPRTAYGKVVKGELRDAYLAAKGGA